MELFFSAKPLYCCRRVCNNLNQSPSKLKVTCNTHVQLTMCYDSANHNGNDENKHDEVKFQLAAVDLNYSTVMV